MGVLAANLLMLLVANRFPHYFTVSFPVYALFLARYFLAADTKQMGRKLVIALCTVLNLAFAVGYAGSSMLDIYVNKTETERHEIMWEDAQRIPVHERNDVIGYEILAADYLSADIVPCYKYYTLQGTWAISNPHIKSDFLDMLNEEKPSWVLIRPDEDMPELMSILDKFYEFQFGNECVLFYRNIAS